MDDAGGSGPGETRYLFGSILHSFRRAGA